MFVHDGRGQRQDKDGHPQNTVWAIAQTMDGYPWVATKGDCPRMEGVRYSSKGGLGVGGDNMWNGEV